MCCGFICCRTIFALLFPIPSLGILSFWAAAGHKAAAFTQLPAQPLVALQGYTPARSPTRFMCTRIYPRRSLLICLAPGWCRRGGALGRHAAAVAMLPSLPCPAPLPPARTGDPERQLVLPATNPAPAAFCSFSVFLHRQNSPFPHMQEGRLLLAPAL